MSWLRLDDAWLAHPKVQSVPPLARLLWLSGALYSCAHLTDGKLDKAVVPMLAAMAGAPPKLARSLVDAGLWHDTGTHYEIHDYLLYNPRRESIENTREKWREKKRESKGDSPGEPTEIREAPTPTPSSLEISTTTSPSYPDEVVVVLNAILEAEYADQNPSAVTRPDAWRAKVRTRLEGEWGQVFAEAFAALPADGETTLYDLVSQVLDEHEHKLHYQILSRIADLEITCTPPKPNESVPDSKQSGPAEDGPNRPSANGVGASSETSSTSQNEPSSASVTDIGSSRRSRSGGTPTEPSRGVSSTPKPAQNGKDRPTVDEPSSPASEPTSSTDPVPSGPAFLGATLAKGGEPKSEVERLTADWPPADQVEALAAWRANTPERRRFEGDIWQVVRVEPNGQVFTVKVHANGVVTGLRADFPADVWRSAELVEA